ncbi:MAG: sugar ABC transporter permease [Candidatus Promineifilaceae bacterium]|jgi:arabinogalactan oligomer/maltooligosaccharide transport system permease protein
MTSATANQKSSSASRNKRISMIIRMILAVVMIFFSLFPAAWAVSASLNPVGNLASSTLIPANPSLENYQKLFNTPSIKYGTWMMNSLAVSISVTIVSVLITTTTAFAFSRFRFKGRDSLLKGILLIQVFPAILAMVAIFALVQQLGSQIPFLGLNTLTGLGFVYLGGAMGINIWLMKGFFDTVPIDIDESAMVDGASHWQTFWMLIFPLVRPVVIVVGLLTFIATYGEFLLARVLLKSVDSFTVMVGLYQMQSQQFATQWGVFCAGAVIAAIPIVVLYLFLQDYIVGGLTSGAVKG